MTQSPKNKNKVPIIVGIVAVGMFALCFALVPLYGLICKATGINSQAANNQQLLKYSTDDKSEKPDLSRSVRVQFLATNHNGMPWEFYPKVKEVTVHPGENNKVYFHVKNPTEKTMSVQAIPAMIPTDALSHFHKIVCFCFEQQTLSAGESKDFLMIFKLDKELPKDIHVITLAYTLYDITPKG